MLISKDFHQRLLFAFVGISGAFSVLLSAWLAHAGAELPTEAQRRLSIALAMQFIHTLALLVTLVWYQQQQRRFLMIAAYCFFIGILCFSGVLYLKTFHLLSLLGKLAPFGGISLVFGWLILTISVSFRK